MSKLLRRIEARLLQARKDEVSEPELCLKLCLKAEELLTGPIDWQSGLRHAALAAELALHLRDPAAYVRWSAASFGRLAMAHHVGSMQSKQPDLKRLLLELADRTLDLAFLLDPPRDVRGYLHLRRSWLRIYQERGEEALVSAREAIAECVGIDLVRAHIAVAAAFEVCGKMSSLIPPAQAALEESLKHPKTATVRIEAMHAYVNALARGGASDDDLQIALEKLPEVRESLHRRTYPMHRTKLHWTEGHIEKRLARSTEQKLKIAETQGSEAIGLLRKKARNHRRRTRKHYQWALDGFIALKAEPEIAMVLVDLLETYEDPEWIVDGLVERAARVIVPGSVLYEPLEKLRRAADNLGRKARETVLAAARALHHNAKAEAESPCPAI